MPWYLEVLLLFQYAVALSVVWKWGKKHGKRIERERAESLCHQAILKRNSGSVRWVWNAISEGREELLPEFYEP